MQKQRLFASIVCLLSLQFVVGQTTGSEPTPFPGKSVAGTSGDAGEVEGPSPTSELDLAAVTGFAQESTQNTACSNPYRIEFPTESEYPYLKVSIRNRELKLAISLGEPNIYLYADKFCSTLLNKTCNALIPGQDLTLKAAGFHDFQFQYTERLVDLTIGPTAQPITINSLPVRELVSIEGPAGVFVGKYGGADGILGLSKSSELVRQIARHFRSCDMRAGFGLHLVPGGSLVFGGLDLGGNSIGDPSQEEIIEELPVYSDSLIQVFGDGGNANPVASIPVSIVFDTAATKNYLSEGIMNQLVPHSQSNAIAVLISGTPFLLNYESLVSSSTTLFNFESQTAATPPAERIVLGAQFFRFAYAALIPGEDQLIFTSDDGKVENKEVKPFQDIPAYSTAVESDDDDEDDSDGAEITGTKETDDQEIEKAASPNPIGPIIGGVVGGVVVLALLIVGGCCLYRRKMLTRQTSSSIEKEYEAEFDAEIGHDVGILPHFTKESGYAHLPTPPPPPPSSQTYAESQYLHPSTEYLPPIRPYSDESPLRSHNGSPAPLVSSSYQSHVVEQSPFAHEDDNAHRRRSTDDNLHRDRRISVAQTVSSITDLPSPMISRNVSTVSRREYPSISQIQTRAVLPQHDENEDDDDVVSVRSGPAYQYRSSAPAAPPRLPFARPENERSDSPL